MTSPGDEPAAGAVTGWTVAVVVPGGEADEASGALWAAGVLGIEERDLAGEIELRAGLAAGADPGEVVARLDGRWAVTVSPVVGDAWLDTWQEHATPVEVGERLRVVPTWIAGVGPDPDGRIDVRLPPHRAFGSGAHPTTRLVLREIERRVRPGTSVLDVGCGSGLLGVAAALLGGSPVVALDVDPVALAATAATAAENGVALEALATPVGALDGERFELVVANIVLPTVAELVPAMARRLAPSGRLVLSGVLVHQLDRLRLACGAAGLAEVARDALDGWASLTVARRRS